MAMANKEKGISSDQLSLYEKLIANQALNVKVTLTLIHLAMEICLHT